MPHIIYHRAGARSARRLAQFMGIFGAQQIPDTEPRPDWLIRYGTPRGVPLIPSRGTLNAQGPLTRQQDRFEHLTMLKLSGVPVPHFHRGRPQRSIAEGHGYLGRTLPHGDRQAHRGQGLTHYQAGQEIQDGHDYYMVCVPKDAEFRVDVVAHRTRVRQLTPPDPNVVAWNTEGTYDAPHTPVPQALEPVALAAVKALRLDFGAVDVIVASGHPYVLEVNTAPELTRPTLAWYAKPG